MVMRLIFVVLISLMFFANDGPVYYVDTASGNDSNPGTLFAPWKTIQRAAYTAEGGSIVHVRSGVYDERVFLTISGSPGALVTFQADGTVVTKGFTIYADYVRVIGFEITNPTISFTDGTGIFVQGRLNEILNNYIHDLLFAEGIWLYGGPTHDSPSTGYNTVAGNRIVRARMSGILIEGTGNYIDSNDISHTIQNPPGAPPRAGADADGMRFFGHGHLVRRNSIHDIWLSDIGNMDPHIDCFQTWGPASDITFEQNRCLNSNDVMQGWMISMLSPDAPISNIMIRNNVMKAFRIANVRGASGVTIVNNSFKSELFYTGPSVYGIELHSSPNPVVPSNV